MSRLPLADRPVASPVRAMIYALKCSELGSEEKISPSAASCEKNCGTLFLPIDLLTYLLALSTLHVSVLQSFKNLFC